MKNKFDYNSFEQTLFLSTKTLIQKLIKQYGEKNLRTFCLYSDEDAGSVVFTFDTYENFKKQISKNGESETDYYKWYFGEWLDDDNLSNELNQISKILFGAYYGETNEEFLQHKNRVYEIIISVLTYLKNEGTFGNFNNDFILTFGISDFENKEQELTWMKKINSEQTFADFKTYRETF